MGLVNKVVPAAQLDAAVKEWTDKLAQRSPTAIALAKALLQRRLGQHSRHQQLRASCRQAVYDTAESKEGVAAFNEKREPNFHKFTR